MAFKRCNVQAYSSLCCAFMRTRRLSERTYVGSQDFRKLRQGADALLIPNEYVGYVEINPDVSDGAPVVRETRIKTAVLHAMVNVGRTTNDIMRNAYPFLTHVQIDSAVGFERSLTAD